MFTKVLVANRGEIACRVIRSLKEMGITSVAIYSDADIDAEHVAMADEAYHVGGSAAKESYLNAEKILHIMMENGVQAVHPGYGFLSENVEFSAACEKAGIAFIGPTDAQILQFGLKHRARALAEEAEVPLVPGTDLLETKEEALEQAAVIGYPVMLKSTAGGGGIGMSICFDAEQLADKYATIRHQGESYFKDSSVFLEKYISSSRHIEVQVFGDGEGKVLVLGERDCSVQRRNQKIIEETPAPNISEETRIALHDAAKRLAEKVSYRSAGTVEFIYDVTDQKFYFLEVNTRLQVEHGITEEVFGVDLVRWMIEQAAGEQPIADIDSLEPTGAAMEFRVYAEDPGRDYQPSSGTITQAVFPENIRCDKWIKTGTEVSSFYDPLIAKLIVKGDDRADVIAKSVEVLAETRIDGFETNLILMSQVLEDSHFINGDVTTGLVNHIDYAAPTFEVVAPGTQTTVQDFPARIGYWSVGVPPSGPMDSLNCRLANKLVGNADDAAALEMTMSGATFKFNTDTTIVLCGGEFPFSVNGVECDMFAPVAVKKGDTVSCGLSAVGQRAYLSVRGGIDVPEYMGSRSTFTLGKFGGHGGRALACGDIIHIGSAIETDVQSSIAKEQQPVIANHWDVAVMYGPHGSPDFFTNEDIEMFFSTDWEVHFNSSRTGVRLIGPKPQWARTDGGEAGLHPSNIHDNPYPIGGIDFTGDMPVILGPDGPSLGGFVCPATVIEAELWKVGQLKPGDTIRFVPVTQETAVDLEKKYEDNLAESRVEMVEVAGVEPASPIVTTFNDDNPQERIVCRQAGDKYLLMEFGEAQLDLRLRFIVHAWTLKFTDLNLNGMIDITPGIRSLQLHYNSLVLSREELLSTIESLLKEMQSDRLEKVPARIVHLPLSWDDEATRLAIEKYMSSVRSNAPWCPSNIEFIRRINDLDSIEAVKEIVFNANYLVMGLGDVYLGAPVATPIDPRHRLVTTKYNPARTWTPENAVGIGGAYMCVYGMEGPGGYQFVGRTAQMWNRYNVTREFEQGKPWLLRYFDQIKFYPVSGDELLKIRRDFIAGRYSLKIEETEFDINEYNGFIEENKESIDAFKTKQQAAFDAEYQYWLENDLLTFEENSGNSFDVSDAEPIPGTVCIYSPVAGSMWKCNVAEGDTVEADTVVSILESMKMEIPINATTAGKVAQVFCAENDTIKSGQLLFTIQPE